MVVFSRASLRQSNSLAKLRIQVATIVRQRLPATSQFFENPLDC
jgi:hypothetical protein